ncbi:MAG: enoyl-CoA hydratase/isomerase family protein [Gammaproteobacteria bacterium]|nr:enoyl-CoA hydratase/isomerase family protein [Gammaproteobacteria bacterium]
MPAISLKKESSVFILTLDDIENDNTFKPDVFDEYDAVFDEIEGSKENAALLITSSSPKTWCNGINLNWLMANSSEMDPFVARMERFLLRAALLNLPTLACMVGNTYAGGAIFAAAMDFRFMRADRGRFCFSEVDVKLPFTPIMMEVIKLLPNRQALNELALTGVRIGGEECLEKQIVDRIFSEDELFERSLEYAAFLAEKDRNTYCTIKHRLRNDLVAMNSSLSA